MNKHFSDQIQSKGPIYAKNKQFIYETPIKPKIMPNTLSTNLISTK